MLKITPNISSCAPRGDRDSRARYAQAPISALFMRMRHRTGRLLVLLSLITAAAPADPWTFATPPLDFALHLGRYVTRLCDGRGLVMATVKRIGICAYGNADPTLQAGLLLGYAT